MGEGLKAILEKFFIPIQLIILYFFDFIFQYTTKKKNIFVVGVDEIANCTLFFSKAFENESVSVNFRQNRFYKHNQYDYSVNIKNKYLFFIVRILYGPYLLAKLANESRVFVYFWWTGFCIDREIDYRFLKYKNKKIVCIFVGDDIRSRKLLKEKCLIEKIDSYVFYDNYDIEGNENRVKRVASLADIYADLVFSPTRKAQVSYLKKSINLFMYMINDNILNNSQFELNKNSKIKVVHAPSSPVLKGTPLVKAAIKKLETEGYDFEYIELQNISNKKVLEILNKSHIVLNQFYADMPGVFGIEAMAKKNAVLMSAEYKNLSENAKNCWVYTRYWEVYDNLKYLLDNPEKIEKYAQSGYDFVKQNYTEEKVRNFYIDIFYKHKIIDDSIIF